MKKLRMLVPMLATAVLVGTTYLLDDSNRDQTSPRSTAAQNAELTPAIEVDELFVNEAELDRLIAVFTRRASDSGESLDHRTAGSYLLQRARLRASVADYAGARDAFASSLLLAPAEQSALLGFGQASLGTHQFAAAGRAAAKLRALDPTMAETLALAGDAAMGAGMYEKAAAALGTLDELAEGTDPALLVRRAQLAFNRGDLSGARSLASDAVDTARELRFPDTSLAFYESFAGHMLVGIGEYGEARALLKSAVAHSPSNQGALGELARLRAAEGRTRAAIALLERANALIAEPDHLVLEADLRTIIGDTDGAAAAYKRAVELATVDADHERAWRRALAFYLLDGPGPQRGYALAQTELAGRRDAGAYDLMAWAHLRTGNLVAARAASQEALRRGGPDASIRYHAGVIAAAAGDVSRSVSLLESALDLHPGFDPIDAPAARDLLAMLAPDTA